MLVFITRRFPRKPIVRVSARAASVTPVVLPALLTANPVVIVGVRLARGDDTARLELPPHALVLVHGEPRAAATGGYIAPADLPSRLVTVPADDAFAEIGSKCGPGTHVPLRVGRGFPQEVGLEISPLVAVIGKSSLHAKSRFKQMSVVPPLQGLCVPVIGIFLPDLANLDCLAVLRKLRAVSLHRQVTRVDVSQELKFLCIFAQAVNAPATGNFIFISNLKGAHGLLLLKATTS